MSDSTLRQIAQLNKLSFLELQARWRSLLGAEPPAYHRRFLVKRLAYRIQELAYGGLSETTRAQMADILQDAGLDEQASIPGRGRMPKRPQDLLLAGTRLVREWNGRRYEVTVTATGFEFEGRPYRSLTAVAKAITGTHWSGRAFFGLVNGKESGR